MVVLQGMQMTFIVLQLVASHLTAAGIGASEEEHHKEDDACDD